MKYLSPKCEVINVCIAEVLGVSSDEKQTETDVNEPIERCNSQFYKDEKKVSKQEQSKSTIKEECPNKQCHIYPLHQEQHKSKYVQPTCEVVDACTDQVLCSSNKEQYVKPTIKQRGCPLKAGQPCRGYDERFAEWEQAIEYLAKNRVNHVFFTGSDASCCPDTHCPIYLKWQEQQKTR